MERTHRDTFWLAWQQHLETAQDPSEITIDAFVLTSEVIERWINIDPKFEHDGELILEHMSKFMDALPRVKVKH